MPATRHVIELSEFRHQSLIHSLYSASLFERDARPSFRRDRGVADWALDLRKPLSESKLLVPTAKAFVEILADAGIDQIAGKGLGAFLLVGGIVAAGDMRSCLLRESRKKYGFREVVEGAAKKKRPIAIVDDLLASGATLEAAARQLRSEGYNPALAVTIFRFGWMSGRERLEQSGLEVLALATLHKRCVAASATPVCWDAPRVYSAGNEEMT